MLRVFLSWFGMLLWQITEASHAIAAEVASAPSAVQGVSRSWFEILLEKNPGLGTVVVSSFLLPVIILFLNNRQTQKIKEIESESSLKKLQEEKDVARKHDFIKRQEEDESAVYGALVNMLFDVQKLYIDLSVDCSNGQCVTDALKKFEKSLEKNHKAISTRLVRLPSVITGIVYGFYQKIGSLIIELKQIQQSKAPELCYVCVFNHGTVIADDIIELHKVISTQYDNLKKVFNETHLRSVRGCCGTPPSDDLKRKYDELAEELKIRNDPRTRLPQINLHGPIPDDRGNSEEPTSEMREGGRVR